MIDITEYGYSGITAFPGGAVPARILAVHRDRFELICKDGPCFGFLHRGTDFSQVPTVGDFVLITRNPSGDSVITALLPRKSAFVRTHSFTGRTQSVAANFDVLMITTSLNAELNPRRLERYISQAEISGAPTVILLTKLDLCPDPGPLIASVEKVCAGVPVIAVSAVTGAGMECLAPYISPGTTVALTGSSGVGKSTLVNALAGETAMKTSSIREDDARGRHTTTHRRLIRLPSGLMVIDTPGMREFALHDSPDGVEEAFPDLMALAEKCRFRDCSHTREPGCALRSAVLSGELDQNRLKSFLKLRAEARPSAARPERASRRSHNKRR